MMQIYRTLEALREGRANLSGTLGFVPTMGYLHEGHLALIRQAGVENAHVAVSIFVNPTQFNSQADLDAYPRDEAHDLSLLEQAGVDFVFLPTPALMYPAGFSTYVQVEGISSILEGAYRPGHFRGVATVVTKLLNLVQPTRAYFGQKDAQQVVVIRRLAQDLNLPVKILVGETVREPDGLAMSSRNVRLTPEGRRAATVLHKALTRAQTAYQDGERQPDTLRGLVLATLADEPLCKTEYVSLADAEALAELDTPLTRPALLSLAAYFGEVRLIDNLLLE